MVKHRRICAFRSRTIAPALVASLLIVTMHGCVEQSGDTAGDGHVSVGDLAEIREHGSLRVLAHRFSGVDGLPRSGHPSRLEQELAERFAASQTLEVEWVWLDEYSELIPALLDGKGDIIAALLTATPEREATVAFGPSLALVREHVVTRDDTPIIRQASDLVGRELTVRESSSYWETLNRIRSGNPDITVVAAPEHLDTEEILYRISSGEYDVTVADDMLIEEAVAYMPNLEVGMPLSDDRSIAWALRPENLELRAAVDSFVRQYNPASKRPDRYREDLPELKERKVLRFLTRNSAATYFVWHGRVMGFEYDLAKKFAEGLGLHAEFIVVPTQAGLAAWLREGLGDIVAAGITPTEERSGFALSFSRPYHFVSEVVVARAADSTLTTPTDLAGRTIVVRRSSSYWGTVEELRRRGIDVTVVEAPESMETEEIIDGVASGLYDLTVSDSHILAIEETWRDDIKGALTLRDTVPHAWVVREGDDELKAAIDSFFTAIYRGEFYNITRRKYFQKPRRVRSLATGRSARTGTISPYDDLFRQYSEQYDFDWMLIVSQSYQESRFDASVVSFAGAVGLMQVLPGTAREMGFESPADPHQGVHAGVKYLRHLYGRLDDVPDATDRLRFSLAAYNAGYGHLSDARRLAAEQGANPNIWYGGVADIMPLLARREYHSRVRYGYCRCMEPVRYVRFIDDRYAAYSAALDDEEN
jgi:membrane-bound lytic murein transglycosylase F